jgi:hypothetical protein
MWMLAGAKSTVSDHAWASLRCEDQDHIHALTPSQPAGRRSPCQALLSAPTLHPGSRLTLQATLAFLHCDWSIAVRATPDRGTFCNSPPHANASE